MNISSMKTYLSRIIDTCNVKSKGEYHVIQLNLNFTLFISLSLSFSRDFVPATKRRIYFRCRNDDTRRDSNEKQEPRTRVAAL